MYTVHQVGLFGTQALVYRGDYGRCKASAKKRSQNGGRYEVSNAYGETCKRYYNGEEVFRFPKAV